ncbi:hypothetical protein [Prevotella sp. OH937_COT-195]|uniref:hypothetical protein n=1 Tax=Prevotella sp. OH937_COT-195 TaxID=2491051 RepID=UPI000F648D6B|nr:hypothetical protein [Prevotella sp. OH937_COT-195]RRD03014.1 hypothetical protein EII32_00740 [Prevotella sp. OH937_COT-195]
MKKIMFMAVVAAAISFTNCTSNTSKGTVEEADSVSTPVVETHEEKDMMEELGAKLDSKDTAGMQSVLTTMNEKIKTLTEQGKLEEAKTLVKQVQDFLANNSEKVKDVIGDNESLNNLVDAVKAIPVDALGAGKEAAENVKEDIKNVTNVAGKKVGETTEQTKKEVKGEDKRNS